MANRKYPRSNSLYFSSITWKIYNYLNGFFTANGKIDSKEFVVNASVPIKLILSLAFSDKEGELYKMKGSLKRLSLYPFEPLNIDVKVRITMAGSRDLLSYSHTHDVSLSVNGEIVFGGFDIHEQIINNYQHSSKYAKIKIICEFLRGDPSVSESNVDIRFLVNDLKNLCTTGKLSDLNLKVDKGKIPVHKAIVKARSPLIRDILNQTPSARELDLSDKISKEKLINLLTYWYTGDLENLPRIPCPDTSNFLSNMRENNLRHYIDPQAITLSTNFPIERETVRFIIKEDFCEMLKSLDKPIPLKYICNNNPWILTIWPKGEEGTDDFINLQIENVSQREQEYSDYLEVFLTNESGVEYGLKSTISCLHIPDTYPISRFMMHDEFYKHQETLLKNNALQVVCRIYSALSKNVTNQASDFLVSVSPEENPYKILTNDLKNLWESEDLSDCRLIASGEEFNVHKAILVARSGYFNEILNGETSIDEVRLCLLEPNDLRKLLKYIYYAEEFDLNSKSALNLYSVFHKYKVARLENICADYLRNHLAEDNVFDVTELAAKFENMGLKDSALQYIRLNSEQLLRTQRWQDLQNFNPVLSSEILNVIGN